MDTPVRRARLQAEVDRITEVIVENCHPEKVFLFGSMANGQVGEFSDIDIVVVMPTGMRFVQRSLYLARLTRPEVGVDFLVYTPDEFRHFVEQGNLFLTEEVLNKGVVLYEWAGE